MTKRNRRIAMVLALMVGFVVLFSTFLIVKEADHDCTGDDCPVCYEINVCINTLKTVGSAAVAAVIVTFFRFFILTLSVFLRKTVCKKTLVSLKVKLSN